MIKLIRRFLRNPNQFCRDVRDSWKEALEEKHATFKTHTESLSKSEEWELMNPDAVDFHHDCGDR